MCPGDGIQVIWIGSKSLYWLSRFLRRECDYIDTENSPETAHGLLFLDKTALLRLGRARQRCSWVSSCCQHPRTAPLTGKGFSSGSGMPSNLAKDRGDYSRAVLIASG